MNDYIYPNNATVLVPINVRPPNMEDSIMFRGVEYNPAKRDIYWSLYTHKCFPPDIKNNIVYMLYYAKENSIPKEIMMEIFTKLKITVDDIRNNILLQLRSNVESKRLEH